MICLFFVCILLLLIWNVYNVLVFVCVRVGMGDIDIYFASFYLCITFVNILTSIFICFHLT